MSTNLKRYIVILPLVFTLLLSCVPMLGAHAELLDKSFVDEIDTNYDSILKEPFDFSSLIPGKLDKTFASSICINNLTGSSYTNMKNLRDNSPYYYYSIFADSSLDSVLSHESSSCYVYCFFSVFSDNSLIEDTSSYYHYSSCGFASYCYYRFDGSTLSSPSIQRNDSDGNFYYSKDLGIPYRFKSNNVVRFSLEQDYYVIYQETNLPDFEYSDGSGHPDSGKLNVTVEIDPPLTGRVDSKLMWNGQKLDNPFIRFALCNNGKKNVHYSFFITDPGYDICSFVNAKPYPVLDYSFPDSVKFALTKEEWQEVNYLDNSTTKAKGQTFWQIQKPGNNRGNFICWSQMRLLKDKNYDCVVLAYASDLDYLPRFGTPQWSACQGNIVEVHRSTFTLTDDTKFDPNNDSFGNTSFKPGQHFSDSFSQYYDQDGVLQTGRFTSSDITGNRNSSNHVYNGNTYSGDYSGVVSSGGNFNSLSYSISGFLSFFNGVWSYIPSNYAALIGLSITSLIVISIFKGVFK